MNIKNVSLSEAAKIIKLNATIQTNITATL
jgi:hypothetical protein